jgi:hypothetical protein
MFFGLFNEMKAMVQSVLAFEKVGKTGESPMFGVGN